MDIKTGLLMLSLLFDCIGTKADYVLGNFRSPALDRLAGPEDDLSNYFEYDTDFRISGGSRAAEGRHPHIVALTVGVPIGILFCGGSLVAHRTILTAAHCLKIKDTIEHLRALVGTNQWNSGGTHYTLSGFLAHPDFVENAYMNDIALFYTTSDVIYTTVVRPVALSFSYVPPDVLVKVVGWGSDPLANEPLLSRDLRELVTVTLDGNECASRWSNSPRPNAPPIDPRTQLCTFHSRDHGICYGDSGGPLTRADNGHQIGVVSWMFPCAKGFPDIYVRISIHQSWLKANIID
ncbi:hypothetical protein PYW07_012016 [Mythimna separata]|uniref:Peptidase S1 domain-containing protein n=1 Tax=Mythimna separata TaxID=271217 RepID=A0AAD7YLH1_MYTSE|nr:hypothetical protein PYW07_012016 [Mythimna separata]